jgi:protein involved in polysaccharide export with SLBB domain
MTLDVCCTAAHSSQVKLKLRYWQLAVLWLMLIAWTTAAAPQQRDPRASQERSGTFSAQDANQSNDNSTDAQGTLADRIIAILQEDAQALEAAKSEVARLTSADPGTISNEAVFRRIRQDSEWQIQIAQDLKARGYDLGGRGSDGAVRDGDDRDSADLRGQRSDRLSDRSAYDSNDRALGGSREPRSDRPVDLSGDRVNDRSEASSLAERRRKREVRPEEEPAEPKLLQRRSPYPGLESLKDLYSQFPAAQGKLKRFGSDTFRLGTGNANELPMDLPAGPEYVLGPGDALVLNIWGSTSQRLNRTIDRQGQIALPEAGTITIAGITIAQAQQSIQQALREQFKNISVEISLGRLRTVRVYVVGDVQRPGAYDVSSLSTPLNALYAAGGPTSRGSLRTLRQYRGSQLVREIDLYEFLLRGVRSDVDRLLPGDTILVPPVGSQVTVAGMVRRPAIYELKGEPGLSDVLDLAGGVLVSATLRQITVERIEAHQRRTMLSMQLPEGSTQEAAAKALVGFPMQDGDQVLVAPILPYNEKAVYLSGHVFRPGKYPYRDGMSVNDLLRSYQDVMPEPADNAEVVRLQPPDFRPATIRFNLSEVLSGDDPINLQPFDVIRVFSRYEVDPPKVFIYGEVLRPGQYPMAAGMTVAGLINMAGGFKRSAYRETADLSSYVVQDGTKVRTEQKAINLGSAMEGDKSADVLLKPGDVLSVRQLTGWKDIGASVTIKGEVAHAGTYGIREGEHLSSVLKRAGGFRESAYPAGAVLERVEVRELGEKTRLELIRRIESTNTDFKPGLATPQEQMSTLQTLQQQRQDILSSLRRYHATGRLVITIGPDIEKWQDTPADVEMRAGDTLVVPKRPDFVFVSGQVFNSSAITYSPGREAGWYLQQAGGPTQTANKKLIFVIRANGSVIGGAQSRWKSGVLSSQLQPGDSVVVPEKIIGGSQFWRNLIAFGQLSSSATIAAALAAGL